MLSYIFLPRKSPPLTGRERGPLLQPRAARRGAVLYPQHPPLSDTAARGLGTAGGRPRTAAAGQSCGLAGLALPVWAPSPLPQGQRGWSGAASPPKRPREWGKLSAAPQASPRHRGPAVSNGASPVGAKSGWSKARRAPRARSAPLSSHPRAALRGSGADGRLPPPQPRAF